MNLLTESRLLRLGLMFGLLGVWSSAQERQGLQASVELQSDPAAGTFVNPVAPVGHDPWVIRYDGAYHYCYSHQGKLWVNSSPDLAAAVQFEGRVVWTPLSGQVYSEQLWAPELHFLDGAWYIYVAASDGRNETHRMYALRADAPQGPFELVGKVAVAEDKWAIDATVLEHRGKRYFVWSGWEGDENIAQHLYIASMASPTALQGSRVKIASPRHDWERRRGNGSRRESLPFVNEGPQVLQRGVRTFVVYSASGSWTDDYCLGLLELTGDDPLDATAWTKREQPVFTSAGDVYAPGHACFIASPDGREDWIVYHTARFSGAGWKREIRMQPFTWDQFGRPTFGTPAQSGRPMAQPSGSSGMLP